MIKFHIFRDPLRRKFLKVHYETIYKRYLEKLYSGKEHQYEFGLVCECKYFGIYICSIKPELFDYWELKIDKEVKHG